MSGNDIGRKREEKIEFGQVGISPSSPDEGDEEEEENYATVIAQSKAPEPCLLFCPMLSYWWWRLARWC